MTTGAKYEAIVVQAVAANIIVPTTLELIASSIKDGAVQQTMNQVACRGNLPLGVRTLKNAEKGRADSRARAQMYREVARS